MQLPHAVKVYSAGLSLCLLSEHQRILLRLRLDTQLKDFPAPGTLLTRSRKLEKLSDNRDW
jgi:hypothetical protein